jgi:hypothetical protein
VTICSSSAREKGHLIFIFPYKVLEGVLDEDIEMV